MSDPLKPGPSLMMKLGSALVHAEETFTSIDKRDANALAADRAAFATAAHDPEVKAWLAEMTKMALLPVKR